MKTAWYVHLAKRVAKLSGKPITFSIAIFLILIWMISGPLFGFSNTWQLVINSCTTIVTFLMVFLIQNTQNRDTEAIQIKLDELIRVTKGAHNALLDLEEIGEEELDAFRSKYELLAKEAQIELSLGNSDTDTPDA